MPRLTPLLTLLLAPLLAPLIAALIGSAAQAQDVQPVPVLNARVIDQTGTLSDAQRGAIEVKLAAFEAAAGPQIVVLIVASTQPEDIASFAYRIADAWKIGRREVGDGVLLIVAKDDRRLRIEVAKALEGSVPDLAARQIVQNTISPAFKTGDYAGGIDKGVDALISRIKGENLPAPAPRKGSGIIGSGVQIEELLMFFFIGVPIIGAVLSGLFGRKLGALLTSGATGTVGGWLTGSTLLGVAAGVVALVLVGIVGVGSAMRSATGGRSGRRGRAGPLIWGAGGFGAGSSAGGWGGGGSSGGFSGGGGFSSGGGGDFGGGGASGDW